MCSPASSSKWIVRTAAVLALALALGPVTALAAVTLPSNGGTASPKATDEGMSQEEVDRRYDRLIEAEHERTNRDALIERLASGLAALAIGLYGYYNDDRGQLTKVIYSATQTAGVVMVSNAILDANEPSLLLLTDRYLNKRKEMNLERFKRGLVLVEQRRVIAEYKRLAYSSALLAAMYAYDGYRSTGSDEVLKNVFYFLSFNFTLISAANFYRLATKDFTVQTAGGQKYEIYLTALPYGSVTVLF